MRFGRVAVPKMPGLRGGLASDSCKANFFAPVFPTKVCKAIKILLKPLDSSSKGEAVCTEGIHDTEDKSFWGICSAKLDFRRGLWLGNGLCLHHGGLDRLQKEQQMQKKPIG